MLYSFEKRIGFGVETRFGIFTTFTRDEECPWHYVDCIYIRIKTLSGKSGVYRAESKKKHMNVKKNIFEI